MNPQAQSGLTVRKVQVFPARILEYTFKHLLEKEVE